MSDFNNRKQFFNIDHTCKKVQFMKKYFSKLPNEIQGKIFNLVCGTIREFCEKYKIDRTDIINSSFINFNRIFVNIFQNNYLYYSHLPPATLANRGDIVVTRASFFLNNYDLSNMDIFMVGGFTQVVPNILHQYFSPQKKDLSNTRDKSNGNTIGYFGLYKIKNYTIHKPNKDDISIYNFINDNNRDKNYDGEFSLHLEKDYVVIRPESILSKKRWSDFID